MQLNSSLFENDIHFSISDYSLGKVLVAQSHKGICSVILGQDEQLLIEELNQQFNHPIKESLRKTNLALQQVINHIEKPRSNFSATLDMHGTEFEKTVWKTLKQIPHGETITYKQLAEKVGQPKAIRAVANACGANKLAVVVPCHRVVSSNGDLAGYRWGTHLKQSLLTRESSNV